MSSIAEAIALAAPSFTGQLRRPPDHAYDDRRRVHNGLIDERPAAIASCHGVADIVDAARLARARETFASLTPYLAATRCVNYLEDDAPNPAAVAYGPNLPRLRAIKTTYDAENFFPQHADHTPPR